MTRRTQGIAAWLVTWEWAGDHAKVDEPVVAVLNYRLGSARVRDFVERLYVALKYDVEEKIALGKQPTSNSYPAQFMTAGGVDWEGQIQCGHNPYLFARLVDNLRVERCENRRERVRWNERPVPEHLRQLNELRFDRISASTDPVNPRTSGES